MQRIQVIIYKKDYGFTSITSSALAGLEEQDEKRKTKSGRQTLICPAGWLVHWVGGGELKTSLLVLSLSFQCYSWLELCFAKPPSFSCLTVNNYLAKLLDPESTKYTACTLCIPRLRTQTILFLNYPHA